MTILPIAPLTPATPSQPISRGDQAAEALTRAAIVQTTEVLGGMIGQSQSETQSGIAMGGKATIGEAEVQRAQAAEAAAAAPESQAEAPTRAVAVAAGRAAARQAGLAPLMADMAQAAAEPQTPAPVKAAIAQVMALGAQMDGQISGPEIRQALQRSGLFLEARLASSDGEAQRVATGTLTAPPKVVPTPTPNSDMKAALLVFREVVKTWVDATPAPAPGALAGAEPSLASPPNAAATAAAASAQLAVRGTPQALASAGSTEAAEAPVRLETPIDAEAPETPAAPSRPAGGWPNVNTAPLARPAPTVPQPALPAFGAIVAEDFEPPPMVAARAASQASTAVAAYGGLEAAPAPPSETPPPYAGAPTHAQAAAQPGLLAGAHPHTVGQRLLSEANAALARTELLQIASLPDQQAVHRPAEEHGARWVFDMPFMTPQGPAAAQFEISRDGGGGGGEGGPALGRTWRARFSLDVEPMGPVHVQVALTGDRARVSLWAERPASMARLRGGEDRLSSALREAALEPEVAFHAGQPRVAAAAPGQFLDQAT